MKKLWIAVVCCGCLGSPAWASGMNLDPYFSAGATAMRVDLAGNRSTAPAFYFAAGSQLNWLTPLLSAEIRLGFGGQYANFNGDINSYTAYLLKPGFAVGRFWQVYGLLGATTMSVNVGGATYASTQFSYGAGVHYHIPNESFTSDAEWMQYRKRSDQNAASITGMDITGITAGFTFYYY